MTTHLDAPRHPKAEAVDGWQRAGLIAVFLWFAVGGVAHFVATDVEVGIVPPYVPHPREVVLITGVFELLGAAGLLWRPSRRLAGLGLFFLTLAVTPANIYMLQRSELFAVPYWVLAMRLPLQAVLLWVITASTGAFGRRAPKRDFEQPSSHILGVVSTTLVDQLSRRRSRRRS